jgi:nucleotide-binding universal stress UspA family protein
MPEGAQKSVLACIEGSAMDQSVCDYAAWISRGLSLPLQLFHNIARPAAAGMDLSGAIGMGSQELLMEELISLEEQRSKLSIQQGKLMLEAARERVVEAGVTEPNLIHRHGTLAESLLDVEQEIRVLVLGVSQESLSADGKHLSAHLETTIRALHSPMLIVNSKFVVPKQVMLAYDGSEASGKALSMLASSPLVKGTPIHLVTVDQDYGVAENLQAQASEKLTQSGHSVIASILSGEASAALCQYQEDNQIDLTLMGAFSHSKLREIVLGSMTAKMLLGASKPLWLLR